MPLYTEATTGPSLWWELRQLLLKHKVTPDSAPAVRRIPEAAVATRLLGWATTHAQLTAPCVAHVLLRCWQLFVLQTRVRTTWTRAVPR